MFSDKKGSCWNPPGACPLFCDFRWLPSSSLAVENARKSDPCCDPAQSKWVSGISYSSRGAYKALLSVFRIIAGSLLSNTTFDPFVLTRPSLKDNMTDHAHDCAHLTAAETATSVSDDLSLDFGVAADEQMQEDQTVTPCSAKEHIDSMGSSEDLDCESPTVTTHSPSSITNESETAIESPAPRGASSTVSSTERKSIFQAIVSSYQHRRNAGEPEPMVIGVGCILCILCLAAVPLLAIGLYDEESARHHTVLHDDDFMSLVDDRFASGGLNVTGLVGSGYLGP